MKKKLLLGLRKNITNLKDKFVEEETQSGEQDGKKGYKNKILNLRISLLIPIRPTKKIPPTLVGNPPRCWIPELLQRRHHRRHPQKPNSLNFSNSFQIIPHKNEFFVSNGSVSNL